VLKKRPWVCLYPAASRTCEKTGAITYLWKACIAEKFTYLPTHPSYLPFKCSAGAAGSSLVYYGFCITDVSQRVVLLPSCKHIQVLFLLRNGFGPIGSTRRILWLSYVSFAPRAVEWGDVPGLW
jgi:hypothetical protein